MPHDPEYVAMIQEARKDFEIETDELGKALEFLPFKKNSYGVPFHYGSSKKKNPQMRAFWAATVAFMLAFIGWFAFAPLLPVVRVDIGICDNQAAVDKITDEKKKVKDCKCKKECKKKIGNANIAGVSFDILTRFILGSVIEAIGPLKTDMLLLTWGATVVAFSTLVTDATGLIIARFFVSVLGSSFVVNQFWNSIMFNKQCVGTANATAGGWGNLGGGLTQLLMPAIYQMFFSSGMSLSASWRAAMFFPVICYVLTTVWIWFSMVDTVTGKWDVRCLGKSNKASVKDYMMCLSDYRVVIMIFQYGASFGQELVFNSILASHFHDVFGVPLLSAGAIALSFGGMNLFARSFGGILSDWLNKKRAMQGRLWAHFIAHAGQAFMLLMFGLMTPDNGGIGGAVFCLVTLSCFMNAAEGTCYGIVPYMIPEQLPLVSAMVGAGGTLGAVIAIQSFYKQIEDDFLPIQLHAAYCAFWTLTIFLFKWEHMGSMFSNPQGAQEEENKNKSKAFDQEEADSELGKAIKAQEDVVASRSLSGGRRAQEMPSAV